MQAAVNCLVREPIRKTLASVTFVAVSRFASPYPRENNTAPARATASWTPGQARADIASVTAWSNNAAASEFVAEDTGIEGVAVVASAALPLRTERLETCIAHP